MHSAIGLQNMINHSKSCELWDKNCLYDERERANRTSYIKPLYFDIWFHI